MLVFQTFMFVEELLPYREFDRVAKPAPRIPFIQTYSVEEVVEWVNKNGISSDNPLKLSIFQNSALLTDGNHRVIAASILKIDIVPVEVTFYDTLEELENTFYQQSIERFKQVA